MTMKLFGILVLVIILVLLMLLIKNVTSPNIVTNIDQTTSEKTDEHFLKNVDLESGDTYELYLQTPDEKEYWIADPAVLKANQKTLKVKGSLLNYLPGEGNRSRGVRLYRNGEEIKAELGAIFKVFEYGTLAEQGVPYSEVFEHVFVEATKEEMIEIHGVNAFADDAAVYDLRLPELPETEHPYRIDIDFPTIFEVYDKENPSRPSTNSINLHNQIIADLPSTDACYMIGESNGNAGEQINGTTQSFTMIDGEQKPTLKKDGRRMIFNNIIPVEHRISYRCTTEAAADKIVNHDFRSYITKADIFPDAVNQEIDRVLTEAGLELTNEDVILAVQRDETSIVSTLNPQKYFLTYSRKK